MIVIANLQARAIPGGGAAAGGGANTKAEVDTDKLKLVNRLIIYLKE